MSPPRPSLWMRYGPYALPFVMPLACVGLIRAGFALAGGVIQEPAGVVLAAFLFGVPGGVRCAWVAKGCP